MAATLPTNVLKCVRLVSMLKTRPGCVLQIVGGHRLQIITLEYVYINVLPRPIFMVTLSPKNVYKLALQLQTSMLITRQGNVSLVVLFRNQHSLTV